ncbi:MAG: M48 family metallopeptidase [Bacilli bacterium]
MKYTIDNKEYEVIITKKNNKNTYIRVKEDLKIYITTNHFATKIGIKNLIDNNIEAIKKMIQEQTKKNKKNEYFNYLGISYEVFIDEVDDIKFLDDAIFVPSEEYLNKWLKNKIKTLFKERLDYNYNRYEESIPYPKLKIRTMKTRWGVCNIRDNSVTLNTKLIEYDIEKLDYVIIHELSHFIHFNHSKLFWNQVEKYKPNYKKIRKELKD